MYKLRIEKLVVGDNRSCYVHREAEFPFPPYAGLRVSFGDEEEGTEIAEVTWDMEHGQFVVAFEPMDNLGIPFEEELTHLMNAGWTVDRETLH